ncbi:hypothetical protein Srufu_035870 [Streptomyces libani subsp. rufus]|nr:hypothetical protein Srufu_035870 [Streptomyces libani subsp. rufus]
MPHPRQAAGVVRGVRVLRGMTLRVAVPLRGTVPLRVPLRGPAPPHIAMPLPLPPHMAVSLRLPLTGQSVIALRLSALACHRPYRGTPIRLRLPA